MRKSADKHEAGSYKRFLQEDGVAFGVAMDTFFANSGVKDWNLTR